MYPHTDQPAGCLPVLEKQNRPCKDKETGYPVHIRCLGCLRKAIEGKGLANCTFPFLSRALPSPLTLPRQRDMARVSLFLDYLDGPHTGEKERGSWTRLKILYIKGIICPFCLVPASPMFSPTNQLCFPNKASALSSQQLEAILVPKNMHNRTTKFFRRTRRVRRRAIVWSPVRLTLTFDKDTRQANFIVRSQKASYNQNTRTLTITRFSAVRPACSL